MVLSVYLGLAFLAPVMMKTGNTLTAQRIYALFRPFCHQMASRSFFLFGGQLVYPTSLAQMEGLETYGEASGQRENDVSAASHFVGNEHMGYKVALCQRDLAIYSSLLAVTLLFIFIRYKGKNIPWYLWFLLGLHTDCIGWWYTINLHYSPTISELDSGTRKYSLSPCAHWNALRWADSLVRSVYQ